MAGVSDSMPVASSPGAFSSSARGSTLRLNPWVESGSTRAPMCAPQAAPSVCSVIEELPMPGLAAHARTPRVVHVLRVIGVLGLGVILLASATNAPAPGLSGEGLGVLAAMVLL